MAETNPFAAFADLTLPVLEDSLGVLYIGYIFGSVGFGFTFFQSYLYYTRYPRDHWAIKTTVTALCLLDAAMAMLSSHAIYYYLVTLFALPVTPDEATSTFSASIEFMLSGFAVFLVQSFYAVRIGQLNQNHVIAAAIILVAAGGAGLGVATTIVILRNNLFVNFAQGYMKATLATGQGLRALSALLITGSLMFYNASAPSAEKPSALDPVASSLTSGLAAAIVQLGCLITFVVMPRKYVWTAFHLLSSRVFINGLLLMLNARYISRGRGVYEEETRMTSRGQTPHSKGGMPSDILFNPSVHRAHNTVNIEVSRTVNRDADKGKLSDADSHWHYKVEAL
ncbi:hypothetical protein B0H10DRAFT_2229289 [Mycena sp. CBHHK59/15]|nr:hypothetical protein B0H10DRAFT_2229289 [Mycena sp. CBHHK59/15]